MNASAGVPEQKRKPRFDFSALNDPPSMQSARKWAADAGTNKAVVELPLDEVIEDPNNPRQAFDEEALQELAASIKERRVYQPIIVREKNGEGKYVIVQGARRYRGSRMAGKATIPAIVISKAEEADYDGYSQVVENIQRENLNALEIAEFVHKRVAAGDSKTDIAKRLGKDARYISVHFAILEASPEAIELLKAGKIVGAYTFYDFTRLQAKAPEVAAKLLAEVSANPFGEMTTASIRAAIKRADAPQSHPEFSSLPAETGVAGTEGEPFQQAAFGSGGDSEGNEGDGGNVILEEGRETLLEQGTKQAPQIEGGAEKPGTTSEEDPATVPGAQDNAQKLPYHNAAHDEREKGGGRIPDPNHVKKPLLLGDIAGEPVKLLLTRRPSAPDRMYVIWEDTGVEDEVELERIRLTHFSEMKVDER